LPRPGKEKAPWRRKPRRARTPTPGEIPYRRPNRQGEETPEARPRDPRQRYRDGNAGASMNRNCPRRPAGPQRQPTGRNLRPNRAGWTSGTGERAPDPACRITPSRFVNRRRGGDAGRRTRSLSGQALEGRTPRARPGEKDRGDRIGSKASRRAGTARTQPDPGLETRERWLERLGCAEGAENLERAEAPATAHGYRDTLWSGVKARGRTHDLFERVAPGKAKTARRTNREAGASNQYGASMPGCLRGADQPQERRTHGPAMGRRRLGYSVSTLWGGTRLSP